MASSTRKREANQRNAQLAKGPHDTSLTRLNAVKHGILSGQVLILTGKGKEDPEEFQQFSDSMREDLAPSGAIEELLVEELIGITWRNRRVLAYERAVISKQRDGAVEEWEQRDPIVLAHKQWTAEQARQKPPEQNLQELLDQLNKSEAVQPANSFLKHVSGLSVKPSDAYVFWYSMQAIALRELGMEERLSSPGVRGKVCVVAQKMGVNLDIAIGSKTESQQYIDCSPEQIQKVVEAACKLKNFSEEDFWGVVYDDALRDLKGAADALEEIELERNREGELAGLPDDASLAKIQRYEAHLTRQFYKALHELQRLQAARVDLRPLGPAAVEIES